MWRVYGTARYTGHMADNYGISADADGVLSTSGFQVGLDLAVGRLTDHAAAQTKKLLRHHPRVETLEVDAGAVTPASGALVSLDLGGPPIGCQWDIEMFYIGDGSNVAATCSGTGYLVATVSAGFATPGTTPLISPRPLLAGPYTALPTTQLPASHISVLSGQHLYAVILSGTAGQLVYCKAQVKQFRILPFGESDL